MPSPYLLDRPAVISFSGGRTSAYMLRQIMDAFGGALPPDAVPVFTNTGKERPETLDFVERVSLEWGMGIVWLEYRRWLTDPGPAAGRWLCKPKQARADRTGLEIVNYASASRDGRPFDELIVGSKMLPNVAIRKCTQWLKIKTSWRYARNVLGWREYTNAVGLRHDEPNRSAKACPKSTPGEWPVMPLKGAGVGRKDVMDYWQAMRGGLDLEDWLALSPRGRPGWDLSLRPEEGNCDLCFLKGQGKLLRLIRRRPEDADWWIEKEKRFVGKTRLFEASRFRKNAPSYENTRRTALEQTVMFDDDSDQSPDCRCTD